MAEGVGEVQGMMEDLGIDADEIRNLMGTVLRNDAGTACELEEGRSGKE